MDKQEGAMSLRETVKAEFDAIHCILMLLTHEYPELKENRDFLALVGICAQEPEHLLAAVAEEVEGMPGFTWEAIERMAENAEGQKEYEFSAATINAIDIAGDAERANIVERLIKED